MSPDRVGKTNILNINNLLAVPIVRQTSFGTNTSVLFS